ncbi:DUF938 domain-containing protein [Hyphobacterium sp.]|uniref:DUF938 domain-containing protein n=1 Tax=Hyphobacterium sp. TaxID=2004662 RepID=UPI0037491DB7
MESRESAEEKLFSPSAARNSQPIADILCPLLKSGARVLEIGSGTGEHGEAVCLRRPDVHWTPSDPDSASRKSQAARAREISAMQMPLDLDVSRDGWSDGLAEIDNLVCCNVIHISPWATAQGLVRGATHILHPKGRIFLYGPFLEGAASAPSNLDFDASLKSRNPEWGVRPLDEVVELFAGHGFELEQRIDMPANNLSLIFKRPE